MAASYLMDAQLDDQCGPRFQGVMKCIHAAPLQQKNIEWLTGELKWVNAQQIRPTGRDRMCTDLAKALVAYHQQQLDESSAVNVAEFLELIALCKQGMSAKAALPKKAAELVLQLRDLKATEEEAELLSTVQKAAQAWQKDLDDSDVLADQVRRLKGVTIPAGCLDSLVALAVLQG